MDTSIYQILSYQQNENKELGILKAIYLSAIDDITSKIIELGLEPKHFYSPTYAKLYEKAVDLALDEKSVAPQDLPDELLSAFNFEDVDPLNYQQDVVDVIEYYKKRQITGGLLSGLSMIEQDKPTDEVMSVIDKIMLSAPSKYETLTDITFDSLYNNPQGEKGVITGFSSFDDTGVKFLNGQLIAVGADTGAGKTTFVLNIMAHQIKIGNKVLFYSLEQPAREIMIKLLTLLSGFSERQILEGKADKEIVQKWFYIIQQNVFVIYKDGLSIAEIKTRAKIIHSKEKVSLICVDYWQLISGAGENTLEKYVNTADGLLAMALSLNLPVIAIGQVDKNSSRMKDLDRNAFSGSKQLSNNSSYIVMLQKDPEAPNAIAKIVKSRKPNHYGKTIALKINPYTEKLSEVAFSHKPEN